MITRLQVRWTITAVMMAILAVACSAESMAVVAYLFPFAASEHLNVADLYLFGMIGVMVYPAIRCARALRRLTADRGSNIHDVPEKFFLFRFIGFRFAR